MYCDIIYILYVIVQTTCPTGAVLCRTSVVFNQPHMFHNCVIHMHNPDIYKVSLLGGFVHPMYAPPVNVIAQTCRHN